MTYRILVDENTSPRVAETLREKGHDAVHVSEVLEVGVTDQRISDYAIEHGCVICTHDDDFLLPQYRQEVPILYYSDDTIDSYEIAVRVEQVIALVPARRDLPPVTNLAAWD